MNILSEIVGEIIISEQETRKDDPIPHGAVIGFEALKEFVNTNQQPTPSNWTPLNIINMSLTSSPTSKRSKFLSRWRSFMSFVFHKSLNILI